MPTTARRRSSRWVTERGHSTTLQYVEEMSRLVNDETSLFPHANPGLMDDDAQRLLRPTNVSMGMMLENISPRLMEPGMPHHNCPDKDPAARVATAVRRSAC